MTSVGPFISLQHDFQMVVPKGFLLSIKFAFQRYIMTHVWREKKSPPGARREKDVILTSQKKRWKMASSQRGNIIQNIFVARSVGQGVEIILPSLQCAAPDIVPGDLIFGAFESPVSWHSEDSVRKFHPSHLLSLLHKSAQLCQEDVSSNWKNGSTYAISLSAHKSARWKSKNMI